MNTSKFSNLDFEKDELTITFLLFISKMINMQKLRHVFVSPYTDGIFDWCNVLKYVIFSVISLLYDKKWTNEEIFLLDDLISKINEGNSKAIRTFMETLKILNSKHLYEAELYFEQNVRLNSEEFGPFYWILLHLMAEAIEKRKNHEFAKSLWKEFVTFVMHRTLRCSLCSQHYKSLASKYEKELLSSNNYVKLWYKIHNEVNVSLRKSVYLETEFEEKDRRVYAKLL